jgi:dihydrofolate reductase
MRQLIVFNSVSIDGYFVDGGGNMSWAHNRDPEFDEFTNGNARGGGGLLVFGRKTWQMMASYWPTPEAVAAMPAVAQTMNSASKLVFSRTLEKAAWNNTRLVKSDPVAEVRRLKGEDGPGMVVMGSGSIVAQLAQANLVDEYQLVVIPVALGAGRTLFDGMKGRLGLRLTGSRAFKNGNVFLTYAPA